MAAMREQNIGGRGGQARDMNEKAQHDNRGIMPVQQENPPPRPDTSSSSSSSSSGGPAGGFDSTPIPTPPPSTIGYSLKFTFHRATNLVMGDAHAFSSDPYVLAQLNTGLRQRHKEDPNLRFRSRTVRKNVDPEWNEDWIVANVPSTGFELKVRVYDEDPADQDDLLGKFHLHVAQVNDQWEGVKDEPHKLTLRRSSRRAVLVRSLAVCFRVVKHITGDLYISIENLGRTGDDGQNCRAYTLGPCRWFKHKSPMLGKLAGVKGPSDEKKDTNGDGYENEVQQYDFQANQIQLQGPVPAQLYHRFVEFKPWVSRMFTAGGLQGMVLSKALHHQHTRVYSFGRSTTCGHFPHGPGEEMTKQFLDLVHYDKGGRIFTYVISLDALWRFTETGKEFGIDMLSKHTMHSDVSVYIAYSGEFFIRRLKKRHQPPPRQPIDDIPQQCVPSHSDAHPACTPYEIDDTPHHHDEDPPTDPSRYELVIDNDSGTYRPEPSTLPLLASFLAHQLPGLNIRTLDCQADAEKMGKMKERQRERKRAEGDGIVYAQGDESSSVSSSDDERLDAAQEAYEGEANQAQAGRGGSREGGAFGVAARDWKRKQGSRLQKGRRVVLNSER